MVSFDGGTKNMKSEEMFLANNRFRFLDYIKEGPALWSVLERIPGIIEEFLDGKKGTEQDVYGHALLPGSVRIPHGSGERSVSVMQTMAVEEDIYIRQAKVFIGRGTTLEYGAIIKGPCVIGENCEIRQGAYLRGSVIIGDGCVVGHVTEVKKSIFMDRTNAGHFAYVGDSVLGSRVNLGAGVILANLQFRTPGEIDSGVIREIVINRRGDARPTGLEKLGSVIGDYTEVGCNTVMTPGVVIGPRCWVYPNTTVPKGFYEPGKFIRTRGVSLSVDATDLPQVD